MMTADTSGQASVSPSAPQRRVVCESVVWDWARASAVRLVRGAPAAAGRVLRLLVAIGLCAGLQHALSPFPLFAVTALPILPSLVAYFALTTESPCLFLAAAALVGVAEATLAPSVAIGFPVLVYVLLGLALRVTWDLPRVRRPRHTISVGAVLCFGSSLAYCAYAAVFAPATSAVSARTLVQCVCIEGAFGAVLVTPLLVPACRFGARAGVGIANSLIACGVLTLAYLLRHASQPASGRAGDESQDSIEDVP